MLIIVFSHPLLLKLAWSFNPVLSSSSSGTAQLFSSLLITCTQKEYYRDGKEGFPLGHQDASRELSVTNVSNHLDLFYSCMLTPTNVFVHDIHNKYMKKKPIFEKQRHWCLALQAVILNVPQILWGMWGGTVQILTPALTLFEAQTCEGKGAENMS